MEEEIKSSNIYNKVDNLENDDADNDPFNRKQSFTELDYFPPEENQKEQNEDGGNYKKFIPKEAEDEFKIIDSPFIKAMKEYYLSHEFEFETFEEFTTKLQENKESDFTQNFIEFITDEFTENFLNFYNVDLHCDRSYFTLNQEPIQISFTFKIPDIKKMHEMTEDKYKLTNKSIKYYLEADKMNGAGAPTINIKKLKPKAIIMQLRRVIMKKIKKNLKAKLNIISDLKKQAKAQLMSNIKNKMNLKNLTDLKKDFQKNFKEDFKIEEDDDEDDKEIDEKKLEYNKIFEKKELLDFKTLIRIDYDYVDFENKEIVQLLKDSLINNLKDHEFENFEKLKNDIVKLDAYEIQTLLLEKVEDIYELQEIINNLFYSNSDNDENEINGENGENVDLNNQSNMVNENNNEDNNSQAKESLNEQDTNINNPELDKLCNDTKSNTNQTIDAKWFDKLKEKLFEYKDKLIVWKEKTVNKIKDYFNTKEEFAEEPDEEIVYELSEEEKKKSIIEIKKEIIGSYKDMLKEVFSNMDEISKFSFENILFPILEHMFEEHENQNDAQEQVDNIDLVINDNNNQESNQALKQKQEADLNEKEKIEILNEFKHKIFCEMIQFFSATVCYFTNLNAKYYIDEIQDFNVDFYIKNEDILKLFEKNQYYVNYRLFFKNKTTYNKMQAIQELDKDEIIELNKIDKSTFLFGSLEKNYSAINDLNEIDIKDKNLENLATVKSRNLFRKLSKISCYDNPMFHPPYDEYKLDESYKNFYRRYDRLDKLHLCKKCFYVKENEPNPPKCSSILRKIDISRVALVEINKLVNIEKLNDDMIEEEWDFDKIMRKVLVTHNYKGFDASPGSIVKTCILNPKLNVEVCELANKFRNLFGEELSFYFIWLSHFINYLFFPALVGIIVVILCTVTKSMWGEKYYLENKIDLWLKFPFSLIVMIWAKIYADSWNKVEQIFNYEWGMNDYNVEGSKIQCNKFTKFLNVVMPEIDPVKQVFWNGLSWTVIGILLIMVIFTNKIVFWFSAFVRAYFSTFLESQGLGVYIQPASLFIIRQLNSSVYESVSSALLEIEIHKSPQDLRNSKVLKAVIFQFFNFYFNLYYIAFLKSLNNEACEFNNCKLELENQVTILLVTAILNDLISLIYFQFFSAKDIINKINRYKLNVEKNEIDAKHKRVNVKDTSVKHDYYIRKIYENQNADAEYIEITLSFGYVIQFGSSSPICFLLCLIQAVLARISDSLKIGVYSHVNFCNGSKGIGPHSKVINFMITIGAITALVMNFISDSRMSIYSLSARFSLIILFENIIFVMLMFMELQKLPLWFNFRSQIKVSYLNYLKSNLALSKEKSTQ